MYATSGEKKVAVKINTPALGDTIAAIPTLRRLSQAYDNKKLTVFSSKPFLFEGHPLVSEAKPLDSSTEGYHVYNTFSNLLTGKKQMGEEEVMFRYSNMDFRQFHAVSLGFTLTEAEMEIDLYIERERELPFKDYVIIHPTHTWPTRTWEQEKWQALIDKLNAAGIPVVAVGRDSKESGTYNTQKPVMNVDIKLGLNLLNDPTNDPAELRWMMNHRARAIVTMDSGILHIAGTTDVNILQLSSSIDYRLRAPYRNGSQAYKYTYVDGGCEMCSSDMASNVKEHGTIHNIPPQVKCMKGKHFDECHPTADQVFDAIMSIDYEPRQENNIEHNMQEQKKLLYLTPHLSTGGMPQFVLTRLKALQEQDVYEVHLVEYTQYSNMYTVQRDQIVDLLGDRFHSIGYLSSKDKAQRSNDLKDYIAALSPDVIHIDEVPEAFDDFNRLTTSFMEWLYNPEQKWRIVETCHNIWYNGQGKQFEPDAYAFCSPHHPGNNFKDNQAHKSVIEYPIINNTPTAAQKAAAKAQLEMDPDKVHILNVGLWTPGKNQGEGVNIAKIFNELFPDKYQFHFVGNQASNFKNYWEPIMQDLPANVKVWNERSDAHTFYQAADVFMFNSTHECNPLAVREAIGYGLITFSRNLPQYLDMFTPYIIPLSENLEENADIILTYLQSQENLQEILQGDFAIPHNDLARFGQEHLDLYHGLTGLPNRTQSTSAPELKLSFDGGLKLHCDSLPAGNWHAEFIVNDAVFYRANELQEGHWYAPSPKWWAEWQVKVYRDNSFYQTLSLDLTGQEVLVNFESSSLGDTLSWMGQMLAYKEQMGLKRLWVRTHKNWLFDQEWYRQHNIELITDHRAARAQIRINIGVFYSNEEPWQKDRHPNDWRHQPLGKIASDQLGIDYVELRPKMAPQFLVSKQGEHKQIVIATKSTAQAKYWNNPHGWNEFTKWHLDQGYQVLHASKEGGGPEGSIQLPEPLEKVALEINSAQYFVGISSGLSWFAWALGAKVVMISGFTPEWTEFEEDCLRIINKDKCWGCWSFDTFDRGDWNWCPSHKGTPRQFECTKQIEASDVIAQIIERGWA